MRDGGRMDPGYRELIAAVTGNLKRYKKLLARLKKRVPRDLDEVFQSAHEKAFEEIDCLRCANCCVTTGPGLLERDIERLAGALRMRPVAFTRRYLRRDEENDWIFKKMPCPFLGADNYCAVYVDRPKACRDYPHTDRKNIHQLFPKTLKNATICPIAARVLQLVEKHYGGNV